VTGFLGGTSVDVYGYADNTYLYAAYDGEAYTSEPGWLLLSGFCPFVPSIGDYNLNFWTPSTASWPAPGFTRIGLFGDGLLGDGFGRTDGSDWVWPDGDGNGDWTGRDIEFVAGHPCGRATVGTPSHPSGPLPNVIEIKIPLDQLTYAGNDGLIGLSGLDWEQGTDDPFADPFFVSLPVGPEDLLDHYTCYDVKEIPPKFEKLIVPVLDQFTEEEISIEVKKPKLICIPCSKDGSPIKNPENFILKLYEVKEAPKLEDKNLLVTDQFGEEDLKVKKVKFLAVPAEKEEIPSP
jgi:hypothetical protein